jgi:hypothetical protein
MFYLICFFCCQLLSNTVISNRVNSDHVPSISCLDVGTIFCKRQISIKLFHLYQRLQCRDKYSFKIKFVFFLYLRLSPNTGIYSAISLVSSYYNYLKWFKQPYYSCWLALPLTGLMNYLHLIYFFKPLYLVY